MYVHVHVRTPQPLHLHYLHLTYTYTDGDKQYVSLLAHYGVGSAENGTTDFDRQMRLVSIILDGQEVAAALAEDQMKQKNPTYVHLTYT